MDSEGQQGSEQRLWRSAEQAAAAAMVAQAKEAGLELTGPDGLLKLFTKQVLETALNEEMTEHLGQCATECGCCIPSGAGRNSKGGSWVRWLTGARKGGWDKSMPLNQRPWLGAGAVRLRDPRDRAKAGLLEA